MLKKLYMHPPDPGGNVYPPAPRLLWQSFTRGAPFQASFSHLLEV